MTKNSFGKASVVDFGFSELAFTDEQGEECAIQTVNDITSILSKESDKSILIGLKEPKCYILEKYAHMVGIQTDGKENGLVEFDLPDEVTINTSIQLSERQVRGLIVRLNQWLEDGRFSED
jgi:hypothetical protein